MLESSSSWKSDVRLSRALHVVEGVVDEDVGVVLRGDTVRVAEQRDLDDGEDV